MTSTVRSSVKPTDKQSRPSVARKKPKPQPTKSEIILKLIRRRKGARMTDLQKATGWQPHSLRAALTKLGKAGYPVVRQKNPGGSSRYQIPGDQK